MGSSDAACVPPKSDEPPLHRAARLGDVAAIRDLVRAGADVNAPYDLTGRDPEVLRLLIEAGADPHAVSELGASPLVEDADGYTPLVRLVAALCRDAEDYDGAFRAFFEGLRGVRLGDGPVPADREAFVSRAAEVMRDFTQRFARDIPVRRTSAFAQQWREEQIQCIAWLGAYQWWWGRREAAGR